MKHLVFALFHDSETADRAVARVLGEDPDLRGRVSVVAHRGVADKLELDETVQHSTELDESDLRRGLAVGAGLGATVGAVVGTVLAGPFGLIGGGPLVAAVFGAGSGSILGMLSGGLVGAGLTDSALKQLADRLESGGVLVTIKTPDAATERRVEAVLRELGADVAQKRVL